MGEASAAEATGVFLIRTDSEDFERTVGSPVDLGDRSDRPEALDGVDEVRLWSVPDGDRNRERFEQMAPGDLLLFYGDGRYVGVGRVGLTFDDGGWASEAFWDGDSTNYVYTVEEFESVDVDRAAVHSLFDYSASYTPQELMRIADDRVTNRLDAIELAVRRYDERN